MEIELWDIGKVKPYANNPRVNDDSVDAVAASIREFGFRQPIVVDADGVIVAGHTRYKAALKLGLEKVPVHVAMDLTPEQIKAYRIADNKTAELSDWNYDLLPIELDQLDKQYKETLADLELLPEPVEKKHRYNTLLKSIIYTPRLNEPPAIGKLYDRQAYDEILAEIDGCRDIPDDVREFLRVAAARMVRFRFDLIAEYYAHAPQRIKRLFERQVLVILDHQSMIEKGLVTLSERFQELLGQ